MMRSNLEDLQKMLDYLKENKPKEVDTIKNPQDMSEPLDISKEMPEDMDGGITPEQAAAMTGEVRSSDVVGYPEPQLPQESELRREALGGIRLPSGYTEEEDMPEEDIPEEPPVEAPSKFDNLKKILQKIGR